jgi:hypothetical protein
MWPEVILPFDGSSALTAKSWSDVNMNGSIETAEHNERRRFFE